MHDPPPRSNHRAQLSVPVRHARPKLLSLSAWHRDVLSYRITSHHTRCHITSQHITLHHITPRHIKGLNDWPPKPSFFQLLEWEFYGMA